MKAATNGHKRQVAQLEGLHLWEVSVEYPRNDYLSGTSHSTLRVLTRKKTLAQAVSKAQRYIDRNFIKPRVSKIDSVEYVGAISA